MGTVTFSDALYAVKNGKAIQRKGWNGKGLMVKLHPGLSQYAPRQDWDMTLPFLYIIYPDDSVNTPGARVPWLASQTDILAEDWVILE